MVAYNITELLCQVERDNNVIILFAIEAGSRAWGFPSPDSDYDVRFVYSRPLSWYLSIKERRDVIELPIEGLLDVNGWDLKKALHQLNKGNPAFLEWLNSPILYWSNGSVLQKLREISLRTFDPKASIYHYLHMARGNWQQYILGKERVNLKKYLYVLRPILCCWWVESHIDLWLADPTSPIQVPIEFEKVLANPYLAEVKSLSPMLTAINDLLERKKATSELGEGDAIPELNDFLASSIKYFSCLSPLIIHGNDQKYDYNIPDLTGELNKLFYDHVRLMDY